MIKKLIGIDPGTTTGFAVKEMLQKTQQLTLVTSCELWRGFELANEHAGDEPDAVLFLIEDARLRNWYGPLEAQLYRKFAGGMHMSAKERSIYKGLAMGAGSVKRDCTAWEEFMEAKGYAYKMVKPKAGKTKMSAPAFKALTGWQGRTNEHSRDAAMLVWGVNPAWL